MADVLKAPSKNEAVALVAWQGCSPDYGYLCFKAVAEKSELQPHLIRRTVRALARKGYLKFATGLTDDEGNFYGAGYGLTLDGSIYVERQIDKKIRGEA